MNGALHMRGLVPRSIFRSPRIFYGRGSNNSVNRCQCQRSGTASSPRGRPVAAAPAATSSHRRRGGGGGGNAVPPYITYGFVVPIAGIAAASVYAYRSCLDDVPYTNRRRFLATTPRWEADMGHQQYEALLKRYRHEILPTDHRASATVRRVGGRIAAAAEDCSRRWDATTTTTSASSTDSCRGRPDVPDTPYTYTVVRSPEANAFVLPGNHVFVLTGLFRYARDEDELASVLGHEMAHNLARHAGERASESLLTGILARLALLADPSGILFSILLPAQALLYSLPHSREHEMEADRIGIVLAGEACYDPRAARRVFSRMREDAEDGNNRGGGAPPPEFVSTHPGYDTRLALFDQWMPEALERFDGGGGNRCRAIRGEMKRARRLAAEMHDGREGRGGVEFPSNDFVKFEMLPRRSVPSVPASPTYRILL